MRTPFAFLLCMVLAPAVLVPAAAQTWTAVPPMGTARAGAASAVLDGRLYVLGGRDASGAPLATAEVYDPATGWSTIADLRDERADAAAAVLDGRIVVMGGRARDGRPSDKAEIYDAAEERWESFEDLDEAREGLSAAVTDGRLFVFGGAGDGGGLLTTTEAYDDGWEEYDEWTLDPARARFGASGGRDGVVIAGGYTRLGPIARVDRYLPDESVTQSLAPLSVARGALALAGTDVAVFAVGGRDASDAVRADVEMLVFENGQWAALTSLPQAREGAVAAILGDDLYVVGGMDRFGGVLASAIRLPGVAVGSEDDPPEAADRSLVLSGPNPSRGGTSLDVWLGRPGPARLAVFDGLGRLIDVLWDGPLPAGTRRFLWSARVAPGAYIVRLEGPGEHIQRTIMVVR